MSKYQIEKQKRSPVKNAKVHRQDRIASRRTDPLGSIASLTSKRSQKKNESAVELKGFEYHDCLENQDSDTSVQSQQSVQSQEFQKSPVIELDNDSVQHVQEQDESLDMVNQVMTNIDLPKSKMNEPIPKKKKRPFLPPRPGSTGLGIAFQKVNTPKQRSNVTEEIYDSSDEDGKWIARTKKRNNTYSKRERQKKELELMQKREQRERYGTDYDDRYTDDFDNEHLGMHPQQR